MNKKLVWIAGILGSLVLGALIALSRESKWCALVWAAIVRSVLRHRILSAVVVVYPSLYISDGAVF